MTRRRWIGLSVVLFGLAAAVIVWASRSRVPDLDRPERVTVISIDGRDRETNDPPTGETLYGYPVLGRVEVNDPDQIRKLIAGLREGLNAPDVPLAKCYWPRHVLRVEQGGQTADYVICFQCQQYRLYLDGLNRTPAHPSISPRVRPVFDKPLADAGIPIAPE